jgi:hypothetical protein
VPCPKTSKLLINDLLTHVDHAEIPFRELVQMFLVEQKLEYSEIARVSPKGTVKNDFADQVLKEKWQAFHEQHAVLRVVDMRWNCGWRRKEDRLS